MSSPTELGWKALKRICRYLVTYHLVRQTVSHIDVYNDTDWEGALCWESTQ